MERAEQGCPIQRHLNQPPLPLQQTKPSHNSLYKKMEAFESWNGYFHHSPAWGVGPPMQRSSLRSSHSGVRAPAAGVRASGVGSGSPVQRRRRSSLTHVGEDSDAAGTQSSLGSPMDAVVGAINPDPPFFCEPRHSSIMHVQPSASQDIDDDAKVLLDDPTSPPSTLELTEWRIQSRVRWTSFIASKKHLLTDFSLSRRRLALPFSPWL